MGKVFLVTFALIIAVLIGFAVIVIQL